MTKTIEEYKNLIKMIREDGKIFGLVSEDREKIYGWQRKIQELKK